MKLLTYAIVRLLLGVVMLYTGLVKVIDLDGFVRTVRDYRFPLFDVPPGDMIVGYSLPWLEVLLGVCLIVGVWKRASYLLLAGLLLSFIIPVGYAQYHGFKIECGCFGGIEAPISGYHILGLLVAAGVVIVLFFKDRKLAELQS